MDRVYDDCRNMEGKEIRLNRGRPTADVVYSYPGGGRTTLEAHDDGVALLVLGPGASSASTDDGVTYPDETMELLLIHSARPPATRSNDQYTDVATAMDHSGSATTAPATRRRSVPSAGRVAGESYTDMLVAHLSSHMPPPATWNNVAHPGSVTASAAVSGVATAYPVGLDLDAVAAGPDTNAVGFGYAIDVHQGMADLGSERPHATATAAAAAAATEPGGGYEYNSGMALPFGAQDVDEAGMVHGGLGGLGLAATSLAMAGLIAGGVDTPVTAIALFGMLIAGVILVTVRVFRA